MAPFLVVGWNNLGVDAAHGARGLCATEQDDIGLASKTCSVYRRPSPSGVIPGLPAVPGSCPGNGASLFVSNNTYSARSRGCGMGNKDDSSMQ